MARNFYRIFTENNPVMEDSKTFGIPEAKGLKVKVSKCIYCKTMLLMIIFEKYCLHFKAHGFSSSSKIEIVRFKRK